jgi:hypothetical protein
MALPHGFAGGALCLRPLHLIATRHCRDCNARSARALPMTRLLRRTALVLALIGVALPVAAARVEIQAGRSYMDRYGTATAFVEGEFAERPLGHSRFSWSPDVAIGWIDGRDVARYRSNSYDTADTIWLGAAGVRLRYGEAGDGWHHWFFATQLAAIHGRTQALSSDYQFVSTLGWQGQRFSLQLRHVSNGKLHYPNRGETMLLVGLGFDL